jgi:hypothetical protein
MVIGLSKPNYVHTSLLKEAAESVSQKAMQEAKALNLIVVFMANGILMERLPNGEVRPKSK